MVRSEPFRKIRVILRIRDSDSGRCAQMKSARIIQRSSIR